MKKTSGRFIIALPDDWEDQTVYSYLGPDDSGVQHHLTLVVDREAGDVAVEDFARVRIDATLRSLQSAELVTERERTLPSGNQAYEAVLKWVPVDGQVVFRKHVYLVVDGAGYTFCANFSKKTLRTIGVEVDRIIDSFGPVPSAEE